MEGRDIEQIDFNYINPLKLGEISRNSLLLLINETNLNRLIEFIEFMIILYENKVSLRI